MMNFRYLLLAGLLSFGIWLLSGCAPKTQVIIEYPSDNETPRNIIFMIGDGMGLSHITASLYQNKKSVFTQFKDIGLVQTHAADNIVTDSGAGATAFSTGKKAPYNSVGVDEKGNSQVNIMELAQKKGISTGIVTTSSIVDATPAAFYAHSKNRYWIDSVSRDLINSKLNFVIGAGKDLFDGTIGGSPYDIKDFQNKGFYVTDIFKTPVNVLPANSSKRILYFNGTETALVRVIGVDHLKRASKKAISYLNKRQPYFLLIEGAQIDWACHAGNKDEFIYRMKGFELAIQEVLDQIRKDKNTLLVITADHATGGLSIREGSKKGDVKLDFSTNGHTGTMVPVFAYGPGSELFRGVMENTEIFDKMAQLLEISIPTPNVN